jgi:transglutaminase-like putative cysteine protease
MDLRPYSFSILLSFVFFFPATAQLKKPLAGKEPSWISFNQYDYTGTHLDQEAEDGYFDIGYDQQVSLEQQSVYCKRSVKILTEAGIQNSSEVSVSFDPSYEQLTFHTIRIIRENTTINQLNLSKIKTIQQEKELNRYLYNGSLSAILFLEDVRKGDIIEYSYTLKGFNPIFKNKYADIYDLNFTIPIGSLYYKLIVPKGREIIIKNSNTDIKPVIQTKPEGTIYEWKLNQVKAVRLQDNIPSWYDPYSIIMISEYKSWKEVNDWAMNLFPIVNDISPALQKKITDIKIQYPETTQQALASLRFVQDDIRYLGVEMGENSHKPGHPNKIFTQRFGDCKDKSYLLCALLHSLGMEAYPVLINTSVKGRISERLPSAGAFDHVTVQLRLNGKIYWFDPTISFQRGAIDFISCPDYQRGLVISPATDDLTKITNNEPGLVAIKEVFDIPDMSGEAKLTATTRYTGSFADDMRSSFSNNSKYEMQKTFREYYAGYYEKITADSLQIEEDEKTGAFITKEYYTITDLWELKDGVKKAFFNPYVIDGVIRRPKDISRTMPFGLMWPAKYKEDLRINLPEDWNADQSFEKINTSSFTMSARFSFNGIRTINLEYSYENLKDHVIPADTREYIDGLDKQDNEFSYMLSYSVDGKSIPSSSETEKKKDNSSFYIGLLILLVIGGIVWWTQRN